MSVYRKPEEKRRHRNSCNCGKKPSEKRLEERKECGLFGHSVSFETGSKEIMF